MTLKEALKDWTDWDGAMYQTALRLGVVSEFKKGDWWSNNPTSTAVLHVLDALVAEGILEYRDEPDSQYRWKWGQE